MKLIGTVPTLIKDDIYMICLTIGNIYHKSQSIFLGLHGWEEKYFLDSNVVSNQHDSSINT